MDRAFPAGNTFWTIGISIPKVPQLVPVAAVDQVIDKFFGAEIDGNILQGPGKDQDQNGRYHGLESIRQGFHHIPELHGAGNQVEDDRNENREERTECQADRSVRIGECFHKALSAEETARIKHPQNTEDDQQDYRHQQETDSPLGFLVVFFCF